MSRAVLPLSGLRAFEAAARHLSLKSAAEELNVTPAAVSHQVKALEDYCGVELFVRLSRAVQLTEAGRAALPLLEEGFDNLAAAVAAMTAATKTGILTVSVAPSFGAKWLLPRLDRFSARHPEFDLRLDATDRLADFVGGGVDLGLRYGRGRYRNLVSECLMEEVTFPVCSPSLLKKGPALCKPDDLCRHTLLHVDWKYEMQAAPNWHMWLQAAGVTEVDVDRGPRFSSESLAVEAAITGQGVALVNGALASGDLRSGRLVRPFPKSVSQATAFCYYLVYPEAKADKPMVRAFRDWLFEEIAREKTESQGQARP